MNQPGFIFGGDTGTSYEQLQRQRKIADSLRAANSRTPRNVGEGIHAITRALVAKSWDKQNDRQEQTMRDDLNSSLEGIFGGWGGAASGPASYEPVSAPSEAGKVASETMAALGTESYTPGDKDSFVKAMWPHAQRVSEQTGLDPRLVIAQAAQETGWGKSAPNNNFFGIKSHGKEGGARLSTQEHMGGQDVTIQDDFRQYGGMGKSADDYARFLQENPRYKEMLSAQDLNGQVAALGRSGYATDPNYAQSVGAIANSIGAPAAQSGQSQGGVRTAQAGGLTPEVMKMIQVMNNPMLPAGQRQVLGALLQQRMQGNDPMRQLDMEYKRAQLDQIRNPRTNMPSSVEEYQFAQQQGFDGSYQDWVTMKGKSGAPSVSTTVNTGNAVDSRPMADKPPKGYQRRWNPEKQTWVDEVIPGSDVATEAQTAEEQAAAAKNQKNASTALVMDEISLARDLIKNQGGFSPTTGIAGALLSKIDSTDAGALKNRLTTIKANIGFDKLQAMRDASPTGGALGQVSEFENRLLQAVYGSLEQAQRDDDLLYNLDRLESVYNRIVHQGIPEDEARQLYKDVVSGGDEGASKAPDYSSMSMGDLTSNPPKTEEEAAAWNKRFDALQGGQ